MEENGSTQINSFLSDFVEQLTEVHPGEIDYIVLYGSVPRGDFRMGESDIDLMVGVKNQNDREDVERACAKLFWELDEKYRLGMQNLAVKKNSERINDLGSSGYKDKPVLVLHQSVLINSERSLFSAFEFFHGFRNSLARHIQIYGRVLYGRDELKKLEAELASESPLRTLFTYHFFVSLAVWPFFPFAPDKMLKRSIRTILTSFEHKLNSKEDAWFTHLAKDSLEAKVHFEKVRNEWPLAKKAAFCFLAPVSIIRMNLVMLKTAGAVKKLPSNG
jgi:predicted nucleotidyltransferase